MKLLKPQFLLVFAGLTLIFLLYKFGKTVGKPETPKMGKPDMANAQKAVTPIAFNELKLRALKQIDAESAKKIMRLEGKTDKESLHQLFELWKAAKQPNMAAKYNSDLAKLENSEKNLTFASRYFIDLLGIEQEPQVRAWQAGEAISLLEMAQKHNPNDESLKTLLASCYIDGTGETMKGVQLLLGITRNNPDNVDAGLILGRLAIQSQQFDKGITRLESLLAKNPNNTEVMYFLAECYKGRGTSTQNNADIAKAKELFNNCKSKVKNPDFAKEIDNYIKTF